jgi:hypothetical protein
MIGPGGLLLVLPSPVCLLSQFQFYGVGFAKENITKLRCEKYFLKVGHIQSTTGDALLEA